MIVARQLDVVSIRQARGKIAAILDADAPIAAAMQQQRRPPVRRDPPYRKVWLL